MPGFWFLAQADGKYCLISFKPLKNMALHEHRTVFTRQLGRELHIFMNNAGERYRCGRTRMKSRFDMGHTIDQAMLVNNGFYGVGTGLTAVQVSMCAVKTLVG